MRSWRGLFAFLCLVFLVIGCSTVKPIGPGRQGLLDRLGRPARGPSREIKQESAKVASAELRGKGVALRWPLDDVQVTSQFGNRGKNIHEGVDLRARSGTPVYAAESGVILFAGQALRGYGKMIVMRHKEGIATVYAHNSRLLVRRGQRVGKGQRIALSGNTGRSRGPHLHFEVRSGVEAVNPLAALPDPLKARARGVASNH